MLKRTPTVDLVHDVKGDGKPELVLVHGLYDSSHSWRNVTPHLIERGFTVVTVDLRGHGESPRPATGYAPTDFMRDVYQLIEKLKLRAPVFVGHSMGARVGYFLAAEPTSRLRGLVIGDIGMNAIPDQYLEVQALVESLPAGLPDEAAAETFLAGRFQEPERSYFRRCLVPDANGTLRWRFSFEAVVETVKEGRASDWIAQAPRIRCPVLIVRGQNSTELSMPEARRMCNAMRRCTLVEIPDVGHDLHEDKPLEFATVIADWARREVEV